MSALGAYNKHGRHTITCPATGPFRVIRADVADAMRDELLAELVALKAENERLKCCGNCKNSEYDGSCFDCKWQPRGEDEWDDLAYPSLTLCCYAPSRWEAWP